MEVVEGVVLELPVVVDPRAVLNEGPLPFDWRTWVKSSARTRANKERSDVAYEQTVSLQMYLDMRECERGRADIRVLRIGKNCVSRHFCSQTAPII